MADLMRYDDLRETELFTFFHFSEMGRRRTPEGLIDIRLKPGAFQEFIDASILVDRESRVMSGILLLDRDWVGGSRTINPFGKDLAKSFVQAVTHPEDRDRAAGIVSTLWRITGSDDIIVRIRDDDSTEPQVADFLDTLVNVYVGTEEEFRKPLGKTIVIIRNVVEVNRKRLRIEVSYADASSD